MTGPNIILPGVIEKFLSFNFRGFSKILPIGNFTDQIGKYLSTHLRISFTSGGSRWCILIENYAIKIPKVEVRNPHTLLTGLNGIWNEWSMWRKEKEGPLAKSMCPILGGLPPFILIMPRLKPLKGQHIDWSSFEPPLGDGNPRNNGYYKGRLVQLDYGDIGSGFFVVNFLNQIYSAPRKIIRLIRSLTRTLKNAIRFEYFNRGNILAINFRNFHARLAISRSGLKSNISEAQAIKKYPGKGLLPIRFSLPFGALNIHPRFTPIGAIKTLPAGLINQIDPMLKNKIRKPYRVEDFGFIQGEFILTKYEHL